MADTKISALTAKTSIAATDLLPIVDESGTPTTKKITEANFEASLVLANQVGGTATGNGNIVRATSPTITTSTILNSAETQQTLTDGATVSWDMNSGGYGVVTLGGNRTIANPTNTRNGAVYVMEIIQDGSGSRILTWSSNFVWAAGTAPTLTTTASKRDFITFVCSNGKLYGNATLNFS